MSLNGLRIRILETTVSTDRDASWVLGRSMPALEKLELQCTRGRIFKIDSDLHTRYPRLSSLSTHNCLVPWNNSIFSHLHQLTITFKFYGKLDPGHTVAAINALFQQLSCVDSITLQNFFSADVFDDPLTDVVLPKYLSTLHIIEDDDESLFRFFTHVAPQDGTQIRVELQGNSLYNFNLLEPLENSSLAAFENILDSRSPIALSMVAEEVEGLVTVTVGGRRARWPTPASSSSWEPIPQDDIYITWGWCTYDESQVSKGKPAVTFDSVLDLLLDLPSDIMEIVHDHEFLVRALNVQRLYVPEASLTCLVNILKIVNGIPHPISGDSTAPQDILLPHLDTLCIVPSKLFPKPDYTSLANYLDERKRIGYPVQELQIPMEVPWDGVEGGDLDGDTQAVVGVSDKSRTLKLLRDSVSVLRVSREGYY
ncbi:hypothetical protein OF83DRAFT_1178831 [Amylostereum chailletii]|nr:hypothetical protein OF83DRAFT_1178831 [Amylostereum chailletii]